MRQRSSGSVLSEKGMIKQWLGSIPDDTKGMTRARDVLTLSPYHVMLLNITWSDISSHTKDLIKH